MRWRASIERDCSSECIERFLTGPEITLGHPSHPHYSVFSLTAARAAAQAPSSLPLKLPDDDCVCPNAALLEGRGDDAIGAVLRRGEDKARVPVVRADVVVFRQDLALVILHVQVSVELRACHVDDDDCAGCQ